MPLETVVWPRVGELVDQSGKLSDLVAHRVHLIAARRWREQGRPIDADLVELERLAAVKRLAAPVLLSRIRRVYDGPAMLLKGAEVAARYPAPELRPYTDLDLLVPDAPAVYRQLVEAGFEKTPMPGPYEHHHQPALTWPGLPMLLELHSQPSWPDWLTPPDNDQLFAGATGECALGCGVLGPSRVHHTLLLVAHAWRDAPLARLGHLLDVYVTCLNEDPGELADLAAAWRIDRVWRSTLAAVGGVLGGERPRASVRALTRQLDSMRERTVIETKLADWVAPFWGLPFPRAVRASGSELVAELRPEHNETWRRKLHRSGTAMRQLFRSRSERDELLRRETAPPADHADAPH